MPRSWTLPVLLCLVAGLASTVSGQSARLATDSRFEPATATPGQIVELLITVEIVDGYHIYGALEQTGLPTTLELSEVPAGLTAKGAATIPSGTRHEPQPGYINHWIEGTAVIRQRFEVAQDAKAGTALSVQASLSYMACTPLMCDPPTSASVAATLKVAATATTDQPKVAAPTDGYGPLTPSFGGFGTDTKVTATAKFEPADVKAGQEVDLVVTVTVVDGWHVYGTGGWQDPVTFTAKDAFGIEPSGEVRTPAGAPHDKAGKTESWLTGTFELRQRMRVDEEEGEGELEVEGELQFMVCDHLICLPPDQLEFVAELEIVGDDTETEIVIDIPILEDTDDDTQGGGDSASTGPVEPMSWTTLIWFAILGGIFALAMPCTYPMIPITFSFFTKQADSGGGNVLALALTYGAGIVLMFAAIGAAFGAITGFSNGLMMLALSPITNGIIGIVFVVFAFSLFGLINLEPPRALQDIAGKASQRGGLGGVFLMGLCLVITSFTCTAPFVGTMIALSSSGGTAMVIGGMTIFGVTMAVPFVILALVPGRVRTMPKAGEWMNTLKFTLGFVELAAAMKFLSNVDVGYHGDDIWVSASAFLWIWASIFAVTALYLFGVFAKPTPQLSLGRKVAATFFMVLAGYCMNSTDKVRLDPILAAICPPVILDATTHREHTIVKDDIPGAIARARHDNKLLLLNFTGFN